MLLYPFCSGICLHASVSTDFQYTSFNSWVIESKKLLCRTNVAFNDLQFVKAEKVRLGARGTVTVRLLLADEMRTSREFLFIIFHTLLQSLRIASIRDSSFRRRTLLHRQKFTC